MLLELTTGIRNDMVGALTINLSEDCPEPTGIPVIAQARISYECIGSILARVGYYGLGDESRLELPEC